MSCWKWIFRYFEVFFTKCEAAEYFEAKSRSTVHPWRATTAHVNASSISSCVTVCCSVAADGTKLPPFVYFKGFWYISSSFKGGVVRTKEEKRNGLKIYGIHKYGTKHLPFFYGMTSSVTGNKFFRCARNILAIVQTYLHIVTNFIFNRAM